MNAHNRPALNGLHPLTSVAKTAELRAQKYILRDVPYLPDYDTLILIDDKNRGAAEADIMLVYELLSTAREIDGRVPVVRIYSDDIRFEGSTALTPSLFTYIEPYDGRKRAARSYALLLHYYITPDERNIIHGDIYYGGDGDICRYTIAFERDGESFFINAEGGDGSILTVTNVVCGERKRRRRFYPLIKVDRHAGYLISGTVIIMTALSVLAVVFTGVGREAQRDAVISLPPVYTSASIDTEPPSAEPHITESAITESAITEPPITEPHITESPITEPPETEPPVFDSRERDGRGQMIAAVKEDGLAILSVTSPVKRGETATLTASGKAGAFYSITVTYSSGKSTADGLERKAAGADGFVEWSWRIGSRTGIGSYTIQVSGADETAETTFEITD